MFKLFTKKENAGEKAFDKAAKKFGINADEIDLVTYDNFIFSYVFMLAISNKKVYLLSTDSKKPEVFELKDIDHISIEKKTDLNLFLKNGRIINLTSVVGVKPYVVRTFKKLEAELKALK